MNLIGGYLCAHTTKVKFIIILETNMNHRTKSELFYVVVKKTVHERNWSTKAWEPALHTHARQEAHKDELGTCEDRSGWIW